VKHDWFGNLVKKSKNMYHQFVSKAEAEAAAVEQRMRNDFAVDSRDITVHHLYAEVLKNPSEESH